VAKQKETEPKIKKISEKDIENALCVVLRQSDEFPELLKSLSIHNNRTTQYENMYDLVQSKKFDLFQDNSDWIADKSIMIDIIGKMTPDIVLRSLASKQNRIIIEVKCTAKLTFGMYDSQITRYFLYLLGATSNNKANDIPRAIIIAAPKEWFRNNTWTHFVNTYWGLAKAFNITIGELHFNGNFDTPWL
jgi:hypothetical protein